ncbi:MAG: hypothetical protein L6Q98_24600 [Anaerolineae bacterium]|nr:hypothetical protein [Anaerolineae bacterium]NUQ07159.1 hypothetical protein [Anaerolineae bacterium]
MRKTFRLAAVLLSIGLAFLEGSLAATGTLVLINLARAYHPIFTIGQPPELLSPASVGYFQGIFTFAYVIIVRNYRLVALWRMIVLHNPLKSGL